MDQQQDTQELMSKEGMFIHPQPNDPAIPFRLWSNVSNASGAYMKRVNGEMMCVGTYRSSDSNLTVITGKEDKKSVNIWYSLSLVDPVDPTREYVIAGIGEDMPVSVKSVVKGTVPGDNGMFAYFQVNTFDVFLCKDVGGRTDLYLCLDANGELILAKGPSDLNNTKMGYVKLGSRFTMLYSN